MKKGRGNTFKKAIRHLKSTQIDEKIQLLNELPTNNTLGIYVVEPEYQVQDPDVEGLPREADFTQDDPEQNGRDTSGLFLEDGTILTVEPPGDTSYILGPMSAMWYAWGNFTTIGYIRQSDRRMVNLGRITGPLGSWDGNGFVSYGQLTLEQALWFRDTPKLNGANNDTPNYRAFYPGPPSNSPDQYGRYYCVITGTPKPTKYTPPPRRVPPKMGTFDKNLPPGSANPYLTDKPVPHSLVGDLMILGLSAAAAHALISALGAAGAAAVARSADQLRRFLEWWNKGRYVRVPDEDTASWAKLAKDDKAQGAKFVDPKTGELVGGQWPTNLWQLKDFIQGKGGFTWQVTRGLGTGPTALSRQMVERPFRSIMNLFNNYQMDGKFIVESKDKVKIPSELIDALDSAIIEMGGDYESIVKLLEILDKISKQNKTNEQKNIKKTKEVFAESARSRILKNIKKPYVLPEQPKVKYKINPKSNRAINVDLMKIAEVPSSFKKAEDRMWNRYEWKENERKSQERKNEVLDYLGNSDHFWEYMTETSRGKSSKIMRENFNIDSNEYKIIRKEQLRGDVLLFIVDENGKKESILQSELSCRIASEHDKELFELYFNEQETLDAEKEPLFKKVSKRLKKEIDYSDKPSKDGYPNQPPPEMINGWHPKFGDRSDYFNKMDPESAKATPFTGNPHIDKKIKAARKQPK